MKALPAPARAILDFWFGAPDSPEHDQPRADWFETDAAFDAALSQRFLDEHERAHDGRVDHWRLHPSSCLALLLLLDQLPRNLFRNTTRAFASDATARAVARHALERHFDRDMPPVRRWFFYLPFEHSEHLGDQGLSLRLHATLPDDADKASAMDWAQRHYDIIARFGRFPHRNSVLGRVSTPEEEAFLRAPESGF